MKRKKLRKLVRKLVREQMSRDLHRAMYRYADRTIQEGDDRVMEEVNDIRHRLCAVEGSALLSRAAGVQKELDEFAAVLAGAVGRLRRIEEKERGLE